MKPQPKKLKLDAPKCKHTQFAIIPGWFEGKTNVAAECLGCGKVFSQRDFFRLRAKHLKELRHENR